MNKASRGSWTAYADAHGLITDASVPDPAPPRSKYGAQKITVDGHKFDSIAESRRFQELKLWQQAGEIAELELQPIFPLHIMALYRSGVEIRIVTVGIFTADFRYLDLRSGEIVVEDVKSEPTKTTAYKLRKRIAEAVHGVVITEVIG